MNRLTAMAAAGRWGSVALALWLVPYTSTAQTDLDDVTTAGAARVRAGQSSQQAVDEVVDETKSLETTYKRLLKEIDGLNVYNAYMERQVEKQGEELAALERSMEEISVVERQIVPLMIRMLDALDRFIELDLPFLLEERRGRVASLRAMMERADVTVAEKFRRVTEAFQIENDFGRTIEAYKEVLPVGGATLEATVLRLGRVGIYFQTNNQATTGRWDPAASRWVVLGGGGHRDQVRRGIRIARRQVAPELLMLEIPTAEVAK